MAGGNKRIIFNTRERVISPDMNRAQRFVEYDRAEIARRIASGGATGIASPGNKLEFGNYVDTNAADALGVGTPLDGDVIEGLVVLPQAGTLNLLVSPGAVWLDDPDGQAGSSDPTPPNPDDSRYKLVVDPGISSMGVLLAALNGVAGIRIDVIEVQRTTTVLEVDNRDVFDPSTGTFIPVAVNKVDEGRLVYRRRAGTVNAGIPANQQGWLPICVIAVPNAATDVDGMTFWDVRPLASDRINAPFQTEAFKSELSDAMVTGNIFTNAAETRLNGFVMNRLRNYNAGGKLAIGDTSVTAYLDAQDTDNWAVGYAPAANALWNLYAIFPAGLPRWVRYTDAPATRVPMGARGVLTFSNLGSAEDTDGARTINLPAASGFTGSAPGVVLLSGSTDGASVLRPITVSGGHTLLEQAQPTPPAAVSVLATDKYTLTANIHFPRTARAVHLRFATTMSGAAVASFQYLEAVSLWVPGFANVVAAISNATRFAALLTGAGPYTTDLAFDIWVPRPMAGSNNTYGSDNLAVLCSWSPTAAVNARTGQTVQILGWKTGD